MQQVGPGVDRTRLLDLMNDTKAHSLTSPYVTDHGLPHNLYDHLRIHINWKPLIYIILEVLHYCLT